MLVALSVLVGTVDLDLAVENHSHDEAVDTQDTRHDNGNNRLEDQVGLQDTHAADADARLGGAVGGAEVAEDEGGGDAHVAEEAGAGVVNI